MNPIVNGTCMATAVTKRDTVISGALQTVATAILKRGTDEATGWNNNDKSAVKQANDVFQSVWKTFDQMRQSAWNQFKHDAAACKTKSGTSTDEPVGSASL
jgi:hypothetical protein